MLDNIGMFLFVSLSSRSSLHRCEVSFPRVPEVGTQAGSYDLRLEGKRESSPSTTTHIVLIVGASAAGQGYQYGIDGQPQASYIEASIEPSEVTIGRGEKANLTCSVKGAQKYTITWTKYAHDTSLPSYARVCFILRGEADACIVSPIHLATREHCYLGSH